MSLRLLMLGTGDFALPSFRALLDSPHQVAGLVTQPDRVGRGHHHHVNPLKSLAEERGVPVFQPERASRPESLARLAEFGADLFVVAAYGQILSSKLLAIPRLGAINVHASLLPKYRGAAPINYAIWNGEAVTGVTIFQIVPALDAGPLLGQVSLKIGPRESAGELETRLADTSPPLLLKVIDELEHGKSRPVPQSPEDVSLAPKMTKEMGLVDWSKSSRDIDRHVRAMQPWPQPYTFLHRPLAEPLRLLILAVEYEEDLSLAASLSELKPGEIINRTEVLYVKSGDGLVRVLQLQPAGKRAMPDGDFLRGHALTPGCRLGPQTG